MTQQRSDGLRGISAMEQAVNECLPMCEACGGACCKYVSISVPYMTADQERWARTRGELDLTTWRIRSRCEHLGGDDRCMIYETRPDVCREYAVGGPMCKDARAAMERERADNGKE